MELVKKAYAKINLSIDVIGKRKDNYHELDMIIQSVNLYDTIKIKKNNSGKISLKCSDESLPTDIKNDAYKAAFLMKEEFSLKSGYNIYIEKKIPIEAGLGGGSSDAASVINSICILEGLNLSDDKLFEIGLKIGAELPYSLKSGLARVRGIGEKVVKLDVKHPYFFTIVKPAISLSTKKIFTRYVAENKKDNYTERLTMCLYEKEYSEALKYMYNDLEKASFLIHKELFEIKNELINLGAKQSLMSGSGTSIYGVFENFTEAKRVAEHFNKKGMSAFAVKPVYS